MSGRQNRRPKYLQDYAGGENSDNEEEFNEEDESADEDDDSGEEYVGGRIRKVNRGKKGSSCRRATQGGEPYKRQRLSNMVQHEY